jgi:hypothetical protein
MSRPLSRQEIQLLHQKRMLKANGSKTASREMPAKQDQSVRYISPADQQRDQANA